MTDFSRIRGLLLDLDGVFYVGDQVIEGAREVLPLLRRYYVCRFITNTSTRSLDSLHAKLTRLGFEVAREEIFSAPQAVLRFLQAQGTPVCHLLLADEVRRDFAVFPQSEARADYVVIGDIGERWNYAILNRAFNLLFAGAELLAVHKNRFWQTETGLKMDIGGFVAALEYASNKAARIFGKPAPDFFRMALEDMGLPPEAVAVVGDDIETDVGGGQQVGLTGILVKTGKYREAFVRASGVRPDTVIDSIRELPALLGVR
ncbi:phospholysine phosphohistidine inorganic pyrophosphate phosphatase [Methylomarinovum caldicuralii]|uniref:Haloacid dehalogenase-like hydrolase domain-containing protein 2 n=1 Tax=Methylomarinovum caldicuralii TaxID=438856 RepID=A0AAU9BT11_9GAMM|nr:TIGR01458 family HAD-type hydrolase [Methylomarinovum caldicuralii]BCX81716.1 phospholysine phosphohistidine inorganic pyrophosphate phosphatase [Methylomarinovum caldicuralii]